MTATMTTTQEAILAGTRIALRDYLTARAALTASAHALDEDRPGYWADEVRRHVAATEALRAAISTLRGLVLSWHGAEEAPRPCSVRLGGHLIAVVLDDHADQVAFDLVVVPLSDVLDLE